MPDFDDWLRPRVRTMQIITLAIAAGAIIATTVLFFVRANNPQAAPDVPSLSYFAAGFVAVSFTLSFAVPAFVRDAQLKKMAAGDEAATPENLIGLCQSTLTVGLALLEGPIFFCAIAYRVDGQIWILAGLLVGVSLMALRLPTELSVLAWLEAAGKRILELRETKP